MNHAPITPADVQQVLQQYGAALPHQELEGLKAEALQRYLASHHWNPFVRITP